MVKGNTDWPAGEAPSGDWPHLLRVGSLIGAVVAVILLAAVLRTGAPERPPVGPGRAAAAPSAPLPGSPAPPAADPVRLEQAVPLARRAAADMARLAASGTEWTAQLALLCDAERVQGILDAHGSHGDLYLLPALHNDAACFRICWGAYADADAARRAADLARPLRAIAATPMPRRVAEVLE